MNSSLVIEIPGAKGLQGGTEKLDEKSSLVKREDGEDLSNSRLPKLGREGGMIEENKTLHI